MSVNIITCEQGIEEMGATFIVLSLYDDDRTLEGGSYRWKDVTDCLPCMEENDIIKMWHRNNYVTIRKELDTYIVNDLHTGEEETYFPEGDELRVYLKMMAIMSGRFLRKYRYTKIEIITLENNV